MTFQELRKRNVERCKPGFKYDVGDLSPDEWLTCVSEEVGEIARVLHRLRIGKVSPSDAQMLIREEVGDVVTYLDLLSERLGIDLGEATRDKFNAVSERIGSPVRIIEP